MRSGLFLLLLASAVIVGCGGGTDSTSDEEHADRMATEHEGDQPVAGAAADMKPARPVEAERVVYATFEDQDVTGYLARPKGRARGLPGILMIHEWWGLNENIEKMARQLAGEGYVVLAIDLYEGEVATESEQARELMMAVNKQRVVANKNLRRAERFLARKHAATKIGVIGWCFGGYWSLRTALLLPEQIDATVIYYGRLITGKDQLEKLKAPILGIFGGKDRGIPVDQVREFESVMQELGKPASIHIYENADHAFANPSGTRYDAEAATDAWQKTLAFFEEHLGS